MPKPMNWDPRKMFDVTPQEMKAIQERATMRASLREEFQRKVTDPRKGQSGTIFDPAVQRFLSMRASHLTQFKHTPKNFAAYIAVVIAPMVAIGVYESRRKKEFESRMRTGQVAYKDRNWKHVAA